MLTFEQLHKLTQRQVRRHFGDAAELTEQQWAFIAAVDAAYRQADEERAILEHSLELTSTELNERYRQLERDVAERDAREAALRAADAEREQLRAQILNLSTPLIPISDTIVVMPLIGALDTKRMQQVLETLLHGLTERGAQVAILDITGVPLVDTEVAAGLLRAAQAVKLLGAHVILTGIRPEVAQTIVGLGLDLRAITTHSDLQRGIRQALERR